ncbi:MAG: hypothetical protein O6939_09710 [Bacteroidetes bacterium]|nr:hypothetical protein [Bacteroidota bacterium]MCZ6694165.1 hypothetical protein [Bacteroidota bacterium]
MNCLIDQVIDSYLRQGQRIETIKKYIWQKYRINIDAKSIKERIKLLRMNYGLR